MESRKSQVQAQKEPEDLLKEENGGQSNEAWHEGSANQARILTDSQ